MSFAYNSDGLRISKTVNGVTTHYVYDGDSLLAEYTNTEAIVYIYDANGSPIGFKYRTNTYAEDTWDVYWYGKNIQGDIVAVYNSTGTKLVNYTYNAWGNFITQYHNGGANTSATYNPYTYRGYYYDSDLGFYYLQSRYYDPAICRFINADGYVSTGQGLLGYNMFAYCNNDPVMFKDETGNTPSHTMIMLTDGTSGGQPTIDFTYLARYNYESGVIFVLDGRLYDKKAKAIMSDKYPQFLFVYDHLCRNSNCSHCNPNIQIYNSYLITDEETKLEIIKILIKYESGNPSNHTWGRTEKSMLKEWEIHNVVYNANISRTSTAHTDFDCKQEGWSYFDYFLYELGVKKL